MSLQKRLRLYGKEASKIEIAKEVSKLLLGDTRLLKDPQSVSEVTRTLGFSSRTTTYKYVVIAQQNGFLALDKEGKPILPKKTQLQEFKQFSENHPILQDPLVDVWYQKQLKKKNLQGLAIAKTMLNNLESLFNTVRCNPEDLIQSKEIAEKYRDAFLIAYKQEKDWRKTKKLIHGSIEGVTLRINYAIASFCAVHGISWERGTSEMSRKIVGHGLYADTRLTEIEFDKAEKWLIEKYGIDSDPYRWFWIGVESCSRFKALYEMKLDFEIIEKNNKTTFLMQVYESKTKDTSNRGKWLKYIKRSNTQKAIQALKKRGGKRIFESTLPKHKFRIWMQDCMKELFTFLEKPEDSLFFTKPAHVLRHLGAHYRLAKGNYTNHVLVAEVGGWMTVDELIKSYGKFPPEKIIDELDKLE